jgi:hypothetical protein
MKTDKRPFILGAGYLAFWVVLGLAALPLFLRIVGDYFGGPSLPWSTLQLVRLGSGGCIGIGLAGAALIIGLASLTESRAAHRALLLALCFVAGWAVVVLLLPLSAF